MYLIKGNKLTRHEVVHFIQVYHMNVEFFNVQIKTKTLFLVVNFNSIYDFIQIVLMVMVIDGILIFENMASSNVH